MTAVTLFLTGSAGEAVALSLLHFLWQGALLGLAGAIALKMLARSTPQVRYLAACLILLAMAVSPLATFLFLSSPSAVTPLHLGAGNFLPTIAAGLGEMNVQKPSWLPTVLALWLLGVCLCSLRTAGGWALAAYRLSSQRRVADEALRNGARTIAEKLGLQRSVRVYESPLASVPSVFGWVRPVIILPVSVVAGLPPAQLEAILAHEMAHIARGDFLVNCAQTVVEMLLFYHPAVWWVSGRIRQEREMCCDAMAVEACGDSVLYSRALLALEEGRQTFVLAATGGDLKARIRSLLQPQAQNTRATFLPAIVILAALLTLAAGVAVRAQEKKADSPYDRWASQDVAYIMSPEERSRWDTLKNDEERA